MEQKIMYNLPKLFNLLNKKSNKEEESEIKEKISKFDCFINSNNYRKVLSLFQNVVLMKIMIFWENQGLKLLGNYKSLFNSYLRELKKYEYEITEENKIKLFNDFDGEEDINEFFSSLIILFLKQKEKDEIELVKILWDEIRLSKFEINDEIKNDLKEFFQNDDYCKEYYKELYEENDLFNLNNENILEEIFDYINYKSPVYIKIESLKDYADQERQYEDYGRTIKINEKEPSLDKILINKIEKIPDQILKKVFKQLKIEISIYFNKKPNYNFYCGEKPPEPMEQLYENYNYDISKPDENNYKEYLNLIKKIRNFIQDNINNIKKSGTIVLILTTFKEEQKYKINLPNEKKDFYIVYCQSHFESDEKNEDNKFETFIENNVLVDGISGKTPGFIFLVNELCNDDYIKG